MGKSPPKLNAKRELFVQELLKGTSQRQAFIKAGYSANNKSDKYIDNKAYELFKNGEVKGRYEELMSEHKEKALWTREMAYNELLELIADSKKDKAFTSRLGAIKELNSLDGLYPKEDKNKDNIKDIEIKIVGV